MLLSSKIWSLLLFAAAPVFADSHCWRDTTCSSQLHSSFPGIWESNMFSPTSRVVQPRKILNLELQELSRFPGRVPTLSGNGSALIFDFGYEVGGIVSLRYRGSGNGTLGLAFSESSNFTGICSDESNGGNGPDEALLTPIITGKEAEYTMPLEKLRGGFRYLTLFVLTDSKAKVNIDAIDLELAFQPTWKNLRAYGGYFHSSDKLLNKIWYASAYTIQTTTVPPDTGREYPLNLGWVNNQSLGDVGETLLVDGAKRDRSAWSGDLLTAMPSLLVTTGDMETAKGSIRAQLVSQNNVTGELPWAGPPLYFYGSDSYHMTTLISFYDYVLFSGDIDFLKENWAQYNKALGYIVAKIDKTGLIDVTSTANWGRIAVSNGHTTDGNAFMYRVLTTAASMARWAGHGADSSQYLKLAQTLKEAINSPKYNWDSNVGAFKNADTDDSIFPEDGNSMAVLYGMANSSSYTSISKQLTTNWGPLGAVCPEGHPGNIVPFIEGLEIKAHLVAREPQRALDLMRTSWGWYLNSPYGTGSTTIEGYLNDGSFKYANDGYDSTGSYPSHSHGWSAGPADALTSFVVGLRPTALGGSEWTLEPQFGDLTQAQGGFTTPKGKFSAGWTQLRKGYSLWVRVPSDTAGSLVLPNSGCKFTVRINNVVQHADCNKSTSLVTLQVKGGDHTVSVS